jgi:hypothetical protein
VLDDGGRPSDHDRGRILLVDRPSDRGRVVAAGLDRAVGMARLHDGSYIVAETDNDPPSPAHTPGEGTAGRHRPRPWRSHAGSPSGPPPAGLRTDRGRRAAVRPIRSTHAPPAAGIDRAPSRSQRRRAGLRRATPRGATGPDGLRTLTRTRSTARGLSSSPVVPAARRGDDPQPRRLVRRCRAVDAAIASAGLVALTIARYSPSPTSWVKVTEMPRKPAAAIPARHSLTDRPNLDVGNPRRLRRSRIDPRDPGAYRNVPPQGGGTDTT